VDKRNFFLRTKNFFVLGISNFVATGIQAVFWIYLASIVNKIEYGEIGFLISIANVAFAISVFGLDKTMIVYGAKNENVFSPVYTLGLISSSVVSIITYIIIQNIAISFLIFGSMVFLLHQSDLTSKKRYVDISKFNLLRSGLIVIFAIILYQYFGVNGIILGFVLGTLPSFIGLYNFAKTKKINISFLKSKTKFMFNNWLATLARQLFFWGDKIIVGVLFGFSFLGSYQLAAQYFLLLSIFPIIVMTYLLPQESQKMPNKKIKILSVGIACILVLISIIIIPSIVNVFFTEFNESIFPMQIMSIAIIPFTIFTIQESQYLGKEISRIVMVGSIFGVGLYFLLIAILGAEFGLIGIASALVIATVMRVIFYTIVGKLFAKI